MKHLVAAENLAIAYPGGHIALQDVSFALAFRTVVTAKRPNVLAPELLGRDTVLMGKTRSRSPLSPCKVASLDEGTLTAEFESPQFAPAPGQRLALYGGEVLAASGVIV